MEDLRKRIAELPPAKQKLLLSKLREREAGRQAEIGPSPLRATGGPYPLSFSQERQWFLDQLDPGTPAFNIPTFLRLCGPLCVASLHRGLREIVRRHESLRTSFPTSDGTAVQKVSPHLTLPLPEIDLSALTAADRQAISADLVRREVRFSFQLERGPLLRTTLVRLAPDEHRLMVVMHHIISDGWSFGVMQRELTQLYAAFRRGQPSPLPELRLQYPDFASWQRQWLQGEVLERHLDFWRRQLDGVPVLELPLDHPRPQIQTFRGRTEPVTIAGQQLARLRQLAQEEGASLYMVLLAVFKALLCRYSRQTDLAVGTFIANRNRAELEHLIGFFVNNLTLRTDLAGNPTFRDLVQRVRRTTLDAYAHQDVPFEKLLEELRPERDMSRPSFFQVMLVLQNVPPSRETLADVTVRQEEGLYSGHVNFDLSLWLFDGDEALRGQLEYNADLFETATARRLAEHLDRLLTATAAAPETALYALPLLSPAERRQLLVEWNRTAADLPWEGVHQLVARHAARQPQAPAVAAAGAILSYGELNARANRLAHFLRHLGVGPEVRAAVCVGDQPERIVAVLAVLKAGGAFVPLDPDYGGQRLGYMLADAGAGVLLTTAELAAQLAGFFAESTPGPTVVRLDAEAAAIDRQPATEPEVAVGPENLAYVVYTSGSTGRPKGVMVSHRALDNAYRAWERRYRLLRDARCHLQMASFSFDVFVGDLVRALCSGGCLVLCPRQVLLEPERLYELMLRHRVDAAEFVPAVVRGLMEHLGERPGDRGLDFMRLLVVGSDTWYMRELRALAARTAARTRVISSYGVSEVTIDSTCFEPATLEPGDPVHAVLRGERPVPIGRPFANTRLYLLDPYLEPVPVGVPGELMIGGPGVARGYLGRPGLSAERFVPDRFASGAGGRLYRTGDLARYLPNGQVEFLGRVDHQVKVRGFRIEPGEVEAALEEHPRVARAVVVARQAAVGEAASGARLVAYFVADPEAGAGPPTATSLRELLARQLPEYMVPSAFVVLDQLPLTPNRKVDRRALPEPDWSRPELRGGFVPPQTPEEEQMAAIWSQVLRVERVGRSDNFFDLGGHSLLATQLVSRVRRVLGVELPLRSLFEAPTVAGLCRRAAAERARERGPEAPPPRPVPRDGPLPLSFAQQRLWFLDRLVPGSPHYNIHFAIRLRGRLDLPRLAACLAAVGQRHETLRTTFAEVDGRPCQVVAPHFTPLLPRIDLTALDAGPRRTETERLARAAGRRPFDLERGPLLRVALLALDAGTPDRDEHVCLLTMHHIISDAWSMGVFFAEIATLYAGLARSTRGRIGPPLPALPVQYADFAAWQRRWLAGPVLEAQLAWWRRQLDGAPEVLTLPTDRPRPPVLSARGARCPIVVPAPLAGSLRELVDAAGATLFMTLLAAFQALLGRYSGQSDVVVGSPIANRNREEIEGLIGFFVNTLVLRAELAGGPTFRELLARTREVCLGAYAHQDLPFEKLVEELRPERDLSRSPLFQAMFVFQNAPVPATTATDFTMSPLALDPGTSKFDLMLELNEVAGGLGGHLEYATDLFDAPTATRLLAHYQRFLEGVAADPGRRITELRLLSPGERHQLLSEWNDTSWSCPSDRCLHQLVEAQAEATPAAVAVVLGEERVSYRELNRRANRLAHYLRSRGVGPEVLVGIHMDRSLEMVVGLVGILKAGGAYLPLDPTYPEQRLAYMLAESRAPVLLTQQMLAHTLPLAGSPVEIVRLDADLAAIADRSADNPPPRAAPESPAYVLYTSGSTGRPKGVVVSHRAIVNLLLCLQEALPLSDRDRLLQKTPFSFDASVWEFWGPLVAGAQLILARPDEHRDPALLVASLRAHRITILKGVPSLFQLLTDDDRFARCADLRRVFCGGEPLTAGLRDRYFATGLNADLINLYGPTEATVDASFAACRRGESRLPVSIGRPIANLRVHLLGEDLRPVPIGAVGKLYVGGVGLARGYLHRARRTAASFVPDLLAEAPGSRLYDTGDLARHLPDGRIDFLGRSDGQIKLRGFRIELGEIETVLAHFPGVRENAVVVRATGRLAGDEELVAYLAGEPAAVRDLREFLRQRLPSYMVPVVFVYLDALPRLPNGKVDRGALAQRVPERPPAGLGEEAAGPRTVAEEILAGMWAELLAVGEVGVDANFFEIGGHSLLATQLVSRVRDAFGVELPLRRLFEAPTIAELAPYVTELRRAGRGVELPPPEPVSRDQELPLSFAQQRLWFLDQLDPGSVAYNLPLAMRLRGPLRPAALAASLGVVRRRHEVLRTTFAARAGKPVQAVTDEPPMALDLVDLQSLPSGVREREARRLGEEEAARPFDLTRGPLLRTRVLRLAGDDHLFLLTMHHIVTDAWSMDVFVREMVTLYGAALRGEPSPLPALPIQYADFACWQRRWVEPQLFAAQMAIWKERLRPPLAVVELPTDRPRPAVQTFRGATRSLPFDEALSAALRQLARRDEVTPFMVVLAGFLVLLRRYTGGEDFPVGTPIANRNRAEIEDLIGFFVNTLVLRNDLSGDPGFSSLLRRVREVALQAWENQDLPFELLVEELEPERSLSRTPVFQIMFALQTHAPLPELPGADLTVSAFPLAAATAKFDFTLFVHDDGERLATVAEYNTDLFDATTVTRFLEHYRRLLSAASCDPSRPISALPFLAPGERHQLLGEWNDTHQPQPLCVHELFAAQVERTPAAPAVAWGREVLTHGELDRRCGRLANHLRALGVGPEVTVGICMERSTWMVVAIVGTVKAGGAYLPLDPTYPPERLAFMLEDARVPVLLTLGKLAPALPSGPRMRVVSLDAEWPQIELRSSEEPASGVTAQNLAYVIYTSGSTGRPKGTELSHRGLANLVAWHREVYRVVPEDRATLLAGPGFDASVWELWPYLAAGASLHVPPPEVVSFPDRLADWLAAEAITLSFLPTPLAEALLADSALAGRLCSLRVLLTGGDRLRRRPAADLPCRLVNHYGPTESTVVTTWSPVTPAAAGAPAPPIGRPLPNLRVHVLDAGLQAVPVGAPGELFIAGLGLARGYLGRPAMTAQRFLPDPFSREPGARVYRSGDAVRWLADGEIEFLGRLDRQVKVRGFRIELGEIEVRLHRHPGVREAAVVTSQGAAGDLRLVAFIVPDPEYHQEELSDYLAAKLPDHMVPSALVPLEALPLTPNGKVDRKVLARLATERLEPAVERMVAPRTPLEEVLAGMWAELLGLEQVGTQDDFFALGGHSLLATQLLSWVQDSFETELPLRLVFEQPTVAGLAEALRADPSQRARVEKTAELLLELAEMDEDEIDDAVGDGRETA